MTALAFVRRKRSWMLALTGSEALVDVLCPQSHHLRVLTRTMYSTGQLWRWRFEVPTFHRHLLRHSWFTEMPDPEALCCFHLVDADAFMIR